MKKATLSRRSLLAASALAAPAINVLGANEAIQVGLIGCGNRGTYDFRNFLKNDAVPVAVCDVNRPHAERAREACNRDVSIHKDYRELLDIDEIDAVVIGTPDHWHALTFVDACKAGKDVFCEKPLSLTIDEGRKMVQAARKYNRVTQGGTQQHSGEHYREAMELIHSGGIGKVTRVQCWFWTNARSGLGNPKPSEPPEGLDWDMYLGPAPWVPYIPPRATGSFRNFWDYSGGQVTDFGAHHFDIIHWGLQQNAPKSIVSEGGNFVLDDCRETPDTQEIIYQYDNCLVQYSIGFGNARKEECYGHTFAIKFFGTDATLFIDRGLYTIKPEDDATDRVKEANIKNHKNLDDLHVKNFLANIKTRGRCNADVEVCHRATTAPLLGDIAFRSGSRLVWDGENETFTNDPKLNSWLSRPYRAPWKLEV